MIKTITLLGAGKSNSDLALAFARKAPDGHLVEVFDADVQAIRKLRQTLSGLQLKSPAVWFSNSAKDAAWGSDVIVLDLPSQKILPMLCSLEDAPNERAIVTSAHKIPSKTADAMRDFIKSSNLQYLDYESEKIKAIWEQAGVFQQQSAFTFGK